MTRNMILPLATLLALLPLIVGVIVMCQLGYIITLLKRHPDIKGATETKVLDNRMPLPVELSQDQVADIRHTLHGGESAKNVAVSYGVSVGRINSIQLGKTYKSCAGPIKGRDY